ncbi:unnamed protein product [Linum tenue]|uniref:Uncharacterized protein n=1 Tax=Linum tenue TaxID=586396 RepID=A0AAV0L638_9ROSI|nr:unnamed protein product [Linum tenue]
MEMCLSLMPSCITPREPPMAAFSLQKQLQFRQPLTGSQIQFSLAFRIDYIYIYTAFSVCATYLLPCRLKAIPTALAFGLKSK